MEFVMPKKKKVTDTADSNVNVHAPISEKEQYLESRRGRKAAKRKKIQAEKANAKS